MGLLSFFKGLFKDTPPLPGKFGEEDIEPDTGEDFLHTYYLSGLKYGRDIGFVVRIAGDIEDAEEALLDYATAHYPQISRDFWGIAEIDDEHGMSEDDINEIGL